MDAYGSGERRFIVLMSAGFVFLAGSVLLSLCAGNYPTTPLQAFQALFGQGVDPVAITAVRYSRVPRLLASLIVGMALSAAGLAFQDVFSSRMASPDVLGVSAGAGCGASFAILAGAASSVIGFSATIGGMAAVLMTLALSRLFPGGNRTASLIMAGIVVGGLMNALLGLSKYLSDDKQLSSIVFWLMGGFDRVTYGQLPLPALVIFFGTGILYLLRWRILILRNGDEDAAAHGISAPAVRAVAIITATAITSFAISLSGTIGWIGLAIPNLVRVISRGSDRHLMPLTVLYGMVFTCFCDFLARTLRNTEIPVGIITGGIGAFLYIAVLLARRKEGAAQWER